MRFSTREDIEAPIDFVFGKLTDFNGFERMAMRRGIDIRREDGQGPATAGSKWSLSFKFRGKPRGADVTLASLDQPNGYKFAFESGGVDGETSIELVPLSPNRTRVMVAIDMKPKTLAARLLLQSMKLAKSNLTQKFKTRVADFAEDIETSYTGV